jgi:putative DNA primase/helicase
VGINELLDRLDNVRASGAGWSARCPAHEDHVASLTVAEGDEQPIVLHCHAGCRPEDIMAAIQGSVADLNGKPHVVDSYRYTDEFDHVLYTVNRWSNKLFTVSPTGVLNGQRTLYRRKAIEHARMTGEALYVVEGEKDVDTLCAYHIPATTAPHGASAEWLPQYTDLLRGLNVVVVADNDEAGVKHARKVYAALEGQTATLGLSVPTVGKDVTDLFMQGYDLKALEPLADREGITSVMADRVTPVPVEWLWDQYIPAASITMLDGDPGSAKSLLTIDLVMRFTTGKAMPNESDHPGPFNCIMVSAEDDEAMTIAPRLIAAGADRSRVRLVTGGINPAIPFNIGVNLEELRWHIIMDHARLVVLDPLSAFMPSDTDSHKDTDVRRALAPLAILARQTRCAFLVVRHLTKGSAGGKAIYAGGGSIAFGGAARSVLMVSGDPMAGDDHKVLAPVKTNLTRRPATLRYSVETSPYRSDMAVLSWHGESIWDADALMGGKQAQDRLKADDARDWLVEFVGKYMEAGGVKWATILEEAKSDGEYSRDMLEKVRLDVLEKVTNPPWQDGFLQGTFWRLKRHGVTLSDALRQLPGTDSNPEVQESVTESNAGEELDEEDRFHLDEARGNNICYWCGSTEVRAYGKPHWKFACNVHNPTRWSPP